VPPHKLGTHGNPTASACPFYAGYVEACRERIQKNMLRTLCAVLVVAQLSLGDDFVKQLTPKDLVPNLKSKPSVLVKLNDTSKMICAIALKEVRVPARMDPMFLPSRSTNFDKGIEHPVPIPVCPSR